MTSTAMPTSARQRLMIAATRAGAGMYWLAIDGANSFSGDSRSPCQPASASSFARLAGIVRRR